LNEPKPSTVVDAHLHVWDPARASYPWLTPDLTVLDRRYAVADIQDELAAHRVTRVVLIQAADNLADTTNMLDQVTRSRSCGSQGLTHVEVAGVVAWVPLSSPTRTARLLDSWADQPIVGVRHLIHREADPDWILRADVGAGLDLLAERGLAFDVCAERLELLTHVPVLARRHPGLRLVIDHLAKPPIASGGWQPWADLLSEAAQAPNVTAKVSGLNTAAGPEWTGSDLQPYVDHALAVFGPDRLMIGGDWPFALLQGRSYSHVWRGLVDTLGGLDRAERDAIFGGTATSVYRLG
jgi:L-fuconolactonase